MMLTPKRYWTSARMFLTIALTVLVGAEVYGQQRRTLVVSGYTGEATVIQRNGRTYVDVESLAEMVKGTLGYQGSQIILTLPGVGSGSPAEQSLPSTSFSREFVNAAIETLGSIREWASTLGMAIKNGYPVGDAIAEYHARAAKNFALAHAAASTESDRNGLQLLTNEFDTVQTWSDKLVKARNSMSAANFALSEDALLNDPLSQKILRCGHFLGPMLASGRFEDDGSCR